MLPENPTATPSPRFPSSFTNAVAPVGASKYVSVAPTRILDTRRGLGSPVRLQARQTISLPVANQAGVPANATAVVLNLTITDAQEWGFVTAYPAGQTLPDASAINVERPGQTVANLVTVPLGAGGAVNLYSYGGAHLIADVQGYFVAATSSTAGRLQPINPSRILDTRASVKLVAGGEIELDVVGLAGLPADTDSVALKVTVADATGAGFWTVYPAGSARPDVSNLNVGAPGQTIANQAIVRLSGGRIRIFSEVGGHVIVDIVGAFSGPSAPDAVDGLFVPVAPTRLLDTRQGLSKPGRRRTFEVPVASRAGLPATGVGAVVVNTTFTDAAQGFGSVWPARTFRPNASSINTSTPGQTIASHVITPVSLSGFAVYLDAPSQVLLDISGWYVGTPTAAGLPSHVPLPGVNGPDERGQYTYLFGLTPPSPRTDIVNPSPTIAPVRWDPCRPIRYVVNMGGYPESYRADIEESIDRIASATGLTFTNAGSSTFVPQARLPFDPTVFNPDSDRDLLRGVDGLLPYELLITLSNETKSDAIDGGVVGRAAPLWATDGYTTPRYLQASLIIDVDDVSNRSSWSGYGVGQVLLHELGHVVGLGHISDNTQIMNPSISGVTTFAGGDLRGLWQVGASRGCVV
jgi:Matrixin